MKHRTYYILVALVIILLLSVYKLIFSPFDRPKNNWYCSPVEPRGNDLGIWQQTITPSSSPELLVEDFFVAFDAGSDDFRFGREHLAWISRYNRFVFELYEMTPGKPLEIEGTVLELSSIGTAFLDANQTMADGAKYRYYDAGLQPIADTDNREFGIYSTEDSSSFRSNPYPVVQFIFKYGGKERIRFRGMKIYDSLTHKLISSGYSAKNIEGSSSFKTHIALWHRTPIDIVVDVSCGSSGIFDLFVKGRRNLINTRSRTRSGRIRNTRRQQPFDKKALLQALQEDKRYRVIIHLPFIPGLPERNDKITDLFDVYIPYVRLHDPDQAARFLGQTLQLRGARSAGPIPQKSIYNSKFLLDFNDVTIRQIAHFYAKGGELNVDIKNNQLSLEYPLPLSTRLKKFLKKIFP